MKTNFLILSLLLAPLPGAFAQSKPTADLIITNAKVWTVDKTHPAAQAVAVLGDRIVALGSNADIDAWRGASTHVIDAAGKLLLPASTMPTFILSAAVCNSIAYSSTTPPALRS